MKKTLLLLAVVGCTLSVSDAATPLYFSSVKDNDMLNVSVWGYFWNLHSSASPASNTNIYAANPIYKGTFEDKNPCDTSDADDMSNGVYNAILTEGNTDYDLVLSGSAVNLEVGSAVYFNTVTPGTTAPTAITLNLGTDGSITTAKEMNFGAGKPTITLQVALSDSDVTALLGNETVYSRDLLSALSSHGIWNAGSGNGAPEKFDRISLTLSNIDALNLTQHEGLLVSDIDQLAVGEYGLLYTVGISSDAKTSNVLTLVVKTPEPATATLSLLALTGLCARRRRH